jgi:sec-independent protein translocase protein TatA
MFGDILQPTHLLLILLVALVVLGPKRLPEVGRSLGRGLRDFRSGLQGVQDEARGMFSDAMDEPSLPPANSAVSTVPEPVAPATAEPVVAASVAAEPATASVTKVMPVEPEPPEFSD